jgi:ParB-like chromosome segregation protein Spo0J
LAITHVPLSSLTEYGNNPRTHSPEQIQQIAESIKAFGFISPLIVDPAGVLIAGHGRFAAARLLALKHVPVVCLDHLSEVQKKALRIADNRLAELAGWDRKLLAIEFSSLIEIETKCDLNFELEVTGFSSAAIDQTIETAKQDAAADPDDDVDSADADPPVSRRGDLWLLDKHTIACGDARDDKIHLQLMGGQLAQMAICDPPYNVKSDGHIRGTAKSFIRILSWLRAR